MAGNEVDSWKQQLPEIPTHSQPGKGVCVLGHTSVGLCLSPEFHFVHI